MDLKLFTHFMNHVCWPLRSYQELLVTRFLHVLFKAATLAFYILFSLFVKSFVIIFVLTVLFAALDFSVVNNVSGRILVGLRWWNQIDDEGNSVWNFDGEDSWLFWWSLYLTPYRPCKQSILSWHRIIAKRHLIYS